MKIPIGKEVNINYAVNLSEDEFLKILSDIEVLCSLVQGADTVVRHLLEENPPLFAAVIQKFLILLMAMNEELVEVQRWGIDVTKELWGLKFSGKEGQA